MRPVPTKWETNRKISFPSYNQIHVAQTLSFRMICHGCCLNWGPKTIFSLWNSFVFSIDFWSVQWAISPLVDFPGDLSFILWEQVSYGYFGATLKVTFFSWGLSSLKCSFKSNSQIFSFYTCLLPCDYPKRESIPTFTQDDLTSLQNKVEIFILNLYGITSQVVSLRWLERSILEEIHQVCR